MASLVKKVDDAVNASRVGRFFEMPERQTTFSIELQGALATFMSMAYILAVNPRILSDSGGPCVVGEDGNIFGDEYSQCMCDVSV
jgi:adenine/guanine/hypoxanthine permease